MSLRAKLLAAQAPLAMVLLVLGVVSLRTLSDLGRSSQRILQDNYRSVLAAQRMMDALQRVDSAASFRVVGRADKADAQAPPSLRAFEEELTVQENNITEPREAAATHELRVLWDDYRAKYDRFRTVEREDEARGSYFAVMEPAFLRVNQAAQRILEINQDAMVAKSDEARRIGERNRALLLFSTAAALAVGILASVSLTRRALRPLQKLSLAVHRIGEGDLDARARLPGKDEIAEVGHELDVMADRLREYRNSSLGELLQAQQASQAAIDSLPDPVVVLSVEGRVLNVNQAAETVLQISGSGDPLARMPPEVRDAIEKVRAHVVSGKGAYAPRGLEEAVHMRSDGGDRALLPRATPLYSEQGGVVGATIVLQDVTRLLRFDELKNDLVATVAHEFRTPLTSLRMATHILVEGTVGSINERQADLLHAARDDCERLQNIVDDLLDLSRIQAGKVEVSLTARSAKSLADAAVAAKVEVAREAGIDLTETLGELVLPVLVDPDRIGLVFENLISNAIRHSPKGGRIEVRAEPDRERVRFEVRDQGPGVPPEYRHRIFEKFFRVPGTKGEGIGLGLYISREIVLAHGGEMGVDGGDGEGAGAGEGGGTRFWFTLRVPGHSSMADSIPAQA
jgi:two-component system, NtrC family, sensor histidine kinase KinB